MSVVWIALLLGQEIRVEPRTAVGAWWIDGSIRFDEKPAVGDRLDVRDDLDWSDPAVRFGVGLNLSADRHVAGFSVGWARFRGSTRFDAPTIWNESLFPPGAAVRTRMDVFDSSVDYRYAVADADALRIEAGVSARYLRFHLETRTPSLPDDDDNLGAFVPGLDARALWRLGAGVTAEGGLSGTAFSASGLRARTWTVRIGARWKASSAVEIGIGVEGGALSLTSEDPRQRNEIDLRGILPELSVALAF